MIVLGNPHCLSDDTNAIIYPQTTIHVDGLIKTLTASNGYGLC